MEDDASLEGEAEHPSFDPCTPFNTNYNYVESINARSANQYIQWSAFLVGWQRNNKMNQIGQVVEFQGKEIEDLVATIKFLIQQNATLVNSVNRIEGMIRSPDQKQ